MSKADALNAATLERDNALKAGGFCEEHTPNGGSRSCQICAMIEMTSAISRISYILEDKPNEMEVGIYNVSYDEELVIGLARKRMEELRSAEQRVRQAEGLSNGLLTELDSARHWERVATDRQAADQRTIQDLTIRVRELELLLAKQGYTAF